jgi:hypothetical protein
MTTLKPGQSLLLNNRLWSLWRVQLLNEHALELEAIGASAAAQGMTRTLKAMQYGDELFIEQRQNNYWYANLQRDWVDGENGPTLHCQPATHLDLLNIYTGQPQPPKNEFSWSYSRSVKYARCPRAYYYHYYAAWEGWQKEAPAPVKQAYLLKNLTNIPQWIGAIVHESIKYALARLKAGQPVANSDLIQQMRRRAQADFEGSQHGFYRQNPNQITGFQEHYYAANLPQAAWQEAWAKAEQCLQTFVNSPLYADLQDQPASTFLDVEELQSFTLANTKVWAQMDLARYDGHSIYIYDWKTGEVDRQTLWQQLGIYALYIRQTWPEWSAAPVRGIVFDLNHNQVYDIRLDEATLQTTQATIEASIAQLQALLSDPQRNLAELRRFPMIDNLDICRGCQFRELCGR